MKPRVAAIVGPTAAGKSALAVEVAERRDAEIVSVDSMQIYRGMDIGTDKASSEMRERIPHHLLDVKDPGADVTVAEFQSLARACIEEISARGKLPLLVGGSGLYFRAVVDELRFPPTEPAVRARLEEESEREGAEALHARLVELDPEAAAKIEPANVRRTVRALEVIQITGRPFSENADWDRYESIYDLRPIGLAPDRDRLDERIEARVRQMLDSGLIEEARSLEVKGMGRTARMALGYRQVLDHPEAGVEELHGAIARATKRFARRQESWFKADPRIRWLPAGR
ncbi:MAG TPA: tRNA (adenosine(37)-N6)-dimethylallyltransferase MiaA [Actinomycetota bacterium]|nr:tRNA (adenosine(37)-N6)-dimethylallyltransferase MiaA [Actinomycetota bacterium]